MNCPGVLEPFSGRVHPGELHGKRSPGGKEKGGRRKQSKTVRKEMEDVCSPSPSERRTDRALPVRHSWPCSALFSVGSFSKLICMCEVFWNLLRNTSHVFNSSAQPVLSTAEGKSQVSWLLAPLHLLHLHMKPCLLVVSKAFASLRCSGLLSVTTSSEFLFHGSPLELH